MDERRRRRTAELREVLPPSPPWEAWLERSGELAPDFARLPSRPGLWAPHERLQGPAAWPGRRADLRDALERWILGAPPPGARGLRARTELLLPDGPGPHPVVLTQADHRGWARAAVARGYAAALVSACDGDDDTDAWPGARHGTWGRLARRAHALSRALDLLEEDPRVDARRVVAGGHSRNGKAALIAAALDPRIAGVISSSAGVLGAIPLRLHADRQHGEGAELLTRHFPDWFHPRLRWFSGREDRLPTDAHELLALIAPRPLLLSVAVHDQVESVPAARATHAVLLDLHAFLGAPGPGPVLRIRPGGHRADAATVAAYLDFCDHVCRGTPAPPAPEVEVGPGAAGPLEVDVTHPPGGPGPLVLWLAPPCPPTGHRAGYEPETESIHAALAAAGFSAASFDPAGTGRRLREPARGPEGDVQDARAALDVLGAPSAWAAGYASGAGTALALAAADPRVLGVAAVAPPHERLEAALRALGGRPALVVAPRWDAHAHPPELARAATAAGPRVAFATPPDFRCGAPARAAVLGWLRDQAR